MGSFSHRKWFPQRNVFLQKNGSPKELFVPEVKGFHQNNCNHLISMSNIHDNAASIKVGDPEGYQHLVVNSLFAYLINSEQVVISLCS